MSGYSDEEITQFLEVLPPVLLDLAKELSSRSKDSAVRHLVSRTGSVRRGERFDDDVADAVFLRIQSRSQHGLYDSKGVIMALGREARRMEGDGEITLYRAAPKEEKIRPGDFATDSASEASFYKHGGHRIMKRCVHQKDVFCVRGSCGGGQEYIYLPTGHVRGPVSEFFGSFNEFFSSLAALMSSFLLRLILPLMKCVQQGTGRASLSAPDRLRKNSRSHHRCPAVFWCLVIYPWCGACICLRGQCASDSGAPRPFFQPPF